MNTKRVTWFDFLRGVAIIMVVGIHTFAATIQTGELASDFIVILRQILNCAVPIFLAISGFFLSKKENVSYIYILKHQIPKVYIPTLIWSLPYFILNIYYGNSWLESTIFFLICGFSIYYFIALIIQYYLMFPVLKKVSLRETILAFVITILSITLVSYLDLVKGYGLSSIVKGGPFPVWLIFFVIGIYLGKMKTRNYRLLPWIVLAIVGLFFSYLETKWVYSFHHSGYGIKPSTHIYSLAIILMLFSQKVQDKCTCCNLIFNAIVYIGRISFGIYLIHCFFITVIGKLCDFNWLLLTIIVLALSIIFISVTRKLLPIVARYVGFY